MHTIRRALLGASAIAAITLPLAAQGEPLTISPAETLEGRGISVIADQNPFNPIFFDEKNGGIQLVLFGDRIATDGAVRLNPTPEQWDPVPRFVGRSVAGGEITVASDYPAQGLGYKVRVAPEGEGFRIAVDLDRPLTAEQAGKAGFNLDFLPSAYFGKTYVTDQGSGLFPRHPFGPMARDKSGDPQPLSAGATTLTLAPEDPLRKISIRSDGAPLALYDARNRAQNGWFVVRSLLPAGKTTDALVWHVQPSRIADWTRAPVVSFNQAGYTPERSKVALIELDPAWRGPAEAELIRLGAAGETVALRAAVTPRGSWKRYTYAAFDFSAVREPGVYAVRFAGQTTSPFRIAADAYDRIWQPSLDTFLPAQMDHIAVREQYRVWTAASHMDDARQAPASLVHFDAYNTDKELDSPFKPGEHIPGLAVGGWQDAGDYDVQTPDNSQVVRNLVWTRELFGTDWDETTVNQAAREVEIRKPDGVEDALQQIEHGTLQLLAQYRVFGHAIDGIVDSTLRQYTHLGDASSQSDGRIYDPALGPDEISGDRSGKPDDRWAFTSDQPDSSLMMAGALAAASRALRTHDPKMAQEALAGAKVIWANQRSRMQVRRIGRGFGWDPEQNETADVGATVELLLATKGDKLYAERLKALLPLIGRRFARVTADAVRAMPLMDAAYRKAIRKLAEEHKARAAQAPGNPFGVPIDEGSWAGAHRVAGFGADAWMLHQAFPDLYGTEDVLNALDYLLGRHPVNSLSLVSAVGNQSKLVAYGHNRADYSFIPGGLVPGVILIKPDFPEVKTDWPFLWYENEYTVATTSTYILAAKAAIAAAAEARAGK